MGLQRVGYDYSNLAQAHLVRITNQVDELDFKKLSLINTTHLKVILNIR